MGKLPKKVDVEESAYKKWQEIYDLVERNEFSLIALQPVVDELKDKEVSHLVRIATGNIRAARTFIIQNQAKLVYYWKVSKHAKKGGEKDEKK